MSGFTNTVHQTFDDSEDFKYGEYFKSTGIGALSGAIAAPLSAAGGLASAGITNPLMSKTGKYIRRFDLICSFVCHMVHVGLLVFYSFEIHHIFDIYIILDCDYCSNEL